MLTAELSKIFEKIGLGEKWRQEGRFEIARITASGYIYEVNRRGHEINTR